MSVLIIGPEEELAIKRLIEEARRNCVPWELLQASALIDHNKPVLTLADRKSVPSRPEPRHMMLGNIEVAFSFEEQPAGVCRHLSVAVAQKGKLPAQAAVGMIAEAFGFNALPSRDGRVWIEEFEPGHHAVNIVEIAELRTTQ